MHRRQRSNVMESKNLVVLVDFLRRHLAAHNLAEYALVHYVAGYREPVVAKSTRPGRRTRMPVAFLASAARRFFVEAGDALAPLELREHVFRSHAMALEQYQTVEPEVRDLGCQPDLITILGGHHGLGSLLADLLDDRVLTFGEKCRDVRLHGIDVAVLSDRRRNALQNIVMSGHRCLSNLGRWTPPGASRRGGPAEKNPGACRYDRQSRLS